MLLRGCANSKNTSFSLTVESPFRSSGILAIQSSRLLKRLKLSWKATVPNFVTATTRETNLAAPCRTHPSSLVLYLQAHWQDVGSSSASEPLSLVRTRFSASAPGKKIRDISAPFG